LITAPGLHFTSPVAAAVQALAQRFADRLAGGLGIQAQNIEPQHFLRAVAGDTGKGGIGGDNAASRIGNQNGVLGGLEYLARQAQQVFVGAPYLHFARQRAGHLLQFGGALGHALLKGGAFQRQLQLGAAQAHMGVGTRQDFLGLERLGDKVNRAERKTAHLVIGIVLGRQEDHRHFTQGRRFLQAPAHFKAVQAGHAHIEQDQVRCARLRRPQRQFAIGRLAHGIASAAQQIAEQLERSGRIFDDQHFSLGMDFRKIAVHGAVLSALNRAQPYTTAL